MRRGGPPTPRAVLSVATPRDSFPRLTWVTWLYLEQFWLHASFVTLGKYLRPSRESRFQNSSFLLDTSHSCLVTGCEHNLLMAAPSWPIVISAVCPGFIFGWTPAAVLYKNLETAPASITGPRRGSNRHVGIFLNGLETGSSMAYKAAETDGRRHASRRASKNISSKVRLFEWSALEIGSPQPKSKVHSHRSALVALL